MYEYPDRKDPMQHSELMALLAAGGVASGTTESAATVLSLSGRLPKYNGMLDPAGAETLGRMLAQALAEHQPTTVLIWEDSPDLILAHITARELAATVVQAFDTDGLVGFTGTFPPAAKVVLLADTFGEHLVAQALALLVEQQGGTVVATAELFTASGESQAPLPGRPAIVLAHLDPASLHDAADQPGTEVST
jgi:hypothetical protein